MRILFVLSASIWSWLVSRCIAFGPNANGIFWKPNMHADTWYRLTPIPAKLPHNIVANIPLFLAIMAMPLLYMDHNVIHVTTVIVLVSEHSFTPIFVAQLHTQSKIAMWSILNTIFAILQCRAVPLLLSCWLIPKILLHIWFTYVQLYLVFKQNIIREREYQERTPRIV